ncbi:hypothetical protein GUJ93_ZPchr0002g25761 [Zizania palustris]|uniref:F-box domain-containing protein n=1 Tax=Zizania palustris TaxID=103762 RepID=A0A8J5VVW9_ZIZPA|nr:hypothetical protein GUJ93_ZPchr0002g25761 [Zizania palustris]
MLTMGSEEWELYPSSFVGAPVIDYGLITGDMDDDRSGDLAVSLDAVLPDDLLEKVLSFLPVASVIRSGCVCKKWHEIVHARRQAWNGMLPQKPWYFMFTCSEEAVSGFAYDPSLRKWYGFDFPCIEKTNWSISSSAGLVCLMDSENRSRIIVCNPITKDWRSLTDAPGGKSADYSALAISVSRVSHHYTVAVARCNQVPSEYYQWEFTIHLYESEIGVLVNNNEHRHCLIIERLVLVGGIGKQDRPGIIKGIGIWELRNKEWHEVARMPHKFFQGFGEFDDVFASCGADDLIYIQSYGSPALLTFEISQKLWKCRALALPIVEPFMKSRAAIFSYNATKHGYRTVPQPGSLPASDAAASVSYSIESEERPSLLLSPSRSSAPARSFLIRDDRKKEHEVKSEPWSSGLSAPGVLATTTSLSHTRCRCSLQRQPWLHQCRARSPVHAVSCHLHLVAVWKETRRRRRQEEDDFLGHFATGWVGGEIQCDGRQARQAGWIWMARTPAAADGDGAP